MPLLECYSTKYCFDSIVSILVPGTMFVTYLKGWHYVHRGKNRGNKYIHST
jgi:hypothetical protein